MNSGRILDLDPAVRMMSGVVLLSGIVLTDTMTPGGMAAAVILAGAAVLLHRRDPLRMMGLILIGSVMYLPAMFWAPAGVAIKGLSAALAVMSPATALSPQETSTVVMRLPLPAFIRFLLLQVLHQTGVLTRETRAIHRAVLVRGGVHGARGIVAFGKALPETWIPRVALRAERVAAAMTIRGYGERMPQAGPIAWNTTGRLALTSSVVLSAFALWYSYQGAG